MKAEVPARRRWALNLWVTPEEEAKIRNFFSGEVVSLAEVARDHLLSLADRPTHPLVGPPALSVEDKEQMIRLLLHQTFRLDPELFPATHEAFSFFQRYPSAWELWEDCRDRLSVKKEDLQ